MYPLKKQKKVREKRKKNEKIKEMVEVSTRIRLDMIRDVLAMNKKTFNNKIFEWAREFGFTIGGDYLIINKNTISD